MCCQRRHRLAWRSDRSRDAALWRGQVTAALPCLRAAHPCQPLSGPVATRHRRATAGPGPGRCPHAELRNDSEYASHRERRTDNDVPVKGSVLASGA
ncbi:hypothetical protein MTO96_049108 [Rhipicephalus appendiculatus]